MRHLVPGNIIAVRVISTLLPRFPTSHPGHCRQPRYGDEGVSVSQLMLRRFNGHTWASRGRDLLADGNKCFPSTTLLVVHTITEMGGSQCEENKAAACMFLVVHIGGHIMHACGLGEIQILVALQQYTIHLNFGFAQQPVEPRTGAHLPGDPWTSLHPPSVLQSCSLIQ